MKVYLVGGAVRDKLLGYPVKERDWVVVGATPDDLLQQGFEQVGRDFPVFLHPKTHEEYALARTERKQAPGYYGFVCDVNPHVSLEEDLKRRDLTINAMAMDEHQQCIDPYGGQADLHAKILRHVSPAFVEDPVRVLRVARFVARYHHLGFKLAHETARLMRQMVQDGELEHLIAERVWQEWQRSLDEQHPDMFLCTLRSCGALRVLLKEVDALFGIPSWREYHAEQTRLGDKHHSSASLTPFPGRRENQNIRWEVDSGIHTLMVLSHAARLSGDPMVRFAASLLDVGRAITPIALWPDQPGYEELGVATIESLCQRLRIPNTFRQFTVMASRLHLRIHRLVELRPFAVIEVLHRADAFRRPEWFEKLLLVCAASVRGRGDDKILQHWRAIVEACRQIKAVSFVQMGYEGKALGRLLDEKRAECVALIFEQLDINYKP